MTIQDLIEKRTIEKTAKTLISYIGRENLEDFIQDMYIIVLQMGDKKIDELGDNLPKYISQVCINQAVGENSNFKKKYQKRWVKLELKNPQQTED